MIKKTVFQMIDECPFLKGLTLDQANDLLPFLSLKKSKRKQFFAINPRGNKRLFCTISGQYKIMEVNEIGDESIKYIATKGDFFGGLFQKGVRDYVKIISPEAIFFCVDLSQFILWLQRHPELTSRYVRELERKIFELEEWYLIMMRSDVTQRLVFFFKRLASKEGTVIGNKTVVRSWISQVELASVLFTSRQSIARSLSALREEGLIVFKRNSVEIANDIDKVNLTLI